MEINKIKTTMEESVAEMIERIGNDFSDGNEKNEKKNNYGAATSSSWQPRYFCDRLRPCLLRFRQPSLELFVYLRHDLFRAGSL